MLFVFPCFLLLLVPHSARAKAFRGTGNPTNTTIASAVVSFAHNSTSLDTGDAGKTIILSATNLKDYQCIWPTDYAWTPCSTVCSEGTTYMNCLRSAIESGYTVNGGTPFAAMCAEGESRASGLHCTCDLDCDNDPSDDGGISDGETIVVCGAVVVLFAGLLMRYRSGKKKAKPSNQQSLLSQSTPNTAEALRTASLLPIGTIVVAVVGLSVPSGDVKKGTMGTVKSIHKNGNVAVAFPGRDKAVWAKPHAHVKKASSQPEAAATPRTTAYFATAAAFPVGAVVVAVKTFKMDKLPGNIEKGTLGQVKKIDRDGDVMVAFSGHKRDRWARPTVHVMVVGAGAGRRPRSSSSDRSKRRSGEASDDSTHYEVLGVAPTATVAEIKRAWLLMTRACHPDKVKGGASVKTAASLWFRRVTLAKEILSDPAKRRAYDAKHKFPGPRAGGSSGSGGGGNAGGNAGRGSAAAGSSAPGVLAPFTAGRRVRITGLKNASQYNGLEAEVENVAETGRVNVAFFRSGAIVRLALKTSNLVPL